LRGKIPIKSITEVNPHLRAGAGVRPALSFAHLRIRYNSYDDVFIAPKEEEAFIEDLRERNPEIVVRESSVY
jgi:PH (Pleckstrin Homology) domain-containing protein